MSIYRNGFHGSDDPRSANKERDIFKFSIPEKIPEFKYERYKVTMEHLLKFCFPPNLEHWNVTGRLDLFALYGPTVNYCSVDGWFWHKCIKLAKDWLRESIAAEEAKERKDKGAGTIIDPTGISTSGSLSITKQNTKTTKMMKAAPRRLLREEDLDLVREDLCQKCRDHVNSFIHLTCGREGQHIMSDIELAELIKEINKTDLYELLKIEKGSTAKIMIETIDLTEPLDIMYTEDDIRNLLSELETDYYERYDFEDMQKIIIEDRRLRINYWVSSITHKPIEKFKNPNLINQNSKVNRDDIKNPYFTLKRILPISLHTKKAKATEDDEEDYNKMHFDHTAKLLQNEQDLVLERTLAKEFHRVTGLEDTNLKDVAVNSILLRDYNDGRHGKWDNYCTLKGQSKGSYVKSKNVEKKEVIDDSR